MQIEPYYGPQSTARPNDFRSYSVSYTSSSSSYYAAAPPPPQKLKKSWNLNDPEFQRKRRVASYKVYSVEGKVKGSFRKSLRWFKDRYTQVVYGWW
ncbi:hypothetical protein PHJA_002812200 [Phtheirospermum japonicum]|uniref:Uncharacterized protein n=1 Tax=Phtheirospermum japonicum TaxID=374723 RepID=A0A830DL83_9LAMI|nr:hypothetical protein PHJA_002812200 [Phtheirospermum japonicum]